MLLKIILRGFYLGISYQNWIIIKLFSLNSKFFLIKITVNYRPKICSIFIKFKSFSILLFKYKFSNIDFIIYALSYKFHKINFILLVS
jgi:hypothetical protein